jgi:hypothetical protein
MRSRGYWRLLVVILTVVSCATATTIPPSQYRSEHGHSYRVHTTSGTSYYVSEFTSDDSTLTIVRFRDIGNRTESVPNTPFQIPLRDVKSVESVNAAGKSSLVGMGVFVGVIFIGAAAIAAASMGE